MDDDRPDVTPEEQALLDKFSLLPDVWQLLNALSQGTPTDVTTGSTSLLQKIENIGTCLADLEQIDLAGEQQDEIIQERICTIEENNKKIERYRKLAVFQQLEKFSSEKQDAEEDVKMATDDS